MPRAPLRSRSVLQYRGFYNLKKPFFRIDFTRPGSECRRFLDFRFATRTFCDLSSPIAIEAGRPRVDRDAGGISIEESVSHAKILLSGFASRLQDPFKFELRTLRNCNPNICYVFLKQF